MKCICCLSLCLPQGPVFLGPVHRAHLYTSEFFPSVSTCGRKRQNPLRPTFCPRTYFFTFAVHARIYFLLQRGWSRFLLSGFTVLRLPASVGSVTCVGLTSVHRLPRGCSSGWACCNRLTKPPPSSLTASAGGELCVECHRIWVARNSKQEQAALHRT